jgi:hypothetical protein
VSQQEQAGPERMKLYRQMRTEARFLYFRQAIASNLHFRQPGGSIFARVEILLYRKPNDFSSYFRQANASTRGKGMGKVTGQALTRQPTLREATGEDISPVASALWAGKLARAPEHPIDVPLPPKVCFL